MGSRWRLLCEVSQPSGGLGMGVEVYSREWAARRVCYVWARMCQDRGSDVVVPGRGRAAPRSFYFQGKEPGRSQGTALALRSK